MFNSVLRNQLTHLFIGALSSQSASDDLLHEVDAHLGKNKRESFKVVCEFYHRAL